MGTTATTALITPDCRANRGDDGAWDEAVHRLRVEYDLILDGWHGEPEQPTIGLVLSLERPRCPS